MKYLCLLLILMVLVSGCAYNKNTLFRIKADTLKLDIPELPNVEAEKANIIINRGVYLGSDKNIPTLHDVRLNEKTETAEDSADIVK